MDADEAAGCSAWVWGNGQAFGEPQHSPEPRKLSLRGRSLRGFGAAAEQALFVTQHGALWASGPNNGRWLFEEGAEDARPPEPVDLLELEGCRVEAAAGGQEHVVAILEEGQRVLSWGLSNEFGQLGHGSTSLTRVRPRAVALPLPRVPVRQVACGEMHSLVLTIAGTLFAFGDGSHGALGLSTRSSTPQPTLVDSGEIRGMPLRAVAAGAQHSMALSLGGSVLSWGNAKHGRLGLGPNIGEVVTSPTTVPYPQDLVRFISAGGRHSAVILRRGVCLLAGDNQHGQLGVSPADLATSDTFMALGGKWRVAALGGMHTLLLGYDGRLYSSGLNDVGQLGCGLVEAPSSSSGLCPIKLPPCEAVVGLVAGPDHCIALTTLMQDLQVPKRTASLGESELRVDVSKIMRTESDSGARRLGPGAATPGRKSLPKVSEDQEMPDAGGKQEDAESDDEPLTRSIAYTGSALRPGRARPTTAPGNLIRESAEGGESDDELPRTLSGGCHHNLSKEIRVKLNPVPEKVKSSSSLETLLRPMAWPGVCGSAKFAGLDVPSLQRLVDALRPERDGRSPEREDLRRSLCAVFGTPSLLNASFCFPGLRRPRVDAHGLVRALEALWQTGAVAGRLEAQLREAVLQGLRRWAGDPETWADAPPRLRHRDQVRGLVTLLLCPLISQTDSSPHAYALMEQIISLIASLPGDGRIAFVDIVIEDMMPVLRSVLVQNVRRYCNSAIRRGAQIRRMGNAVWNGLLVLDILAFANQSFQRQIRSELPATLASPGGDADLTRTISNVLSRSRSQAGGPAPASPPGGVAGGSGVFAMPAPPAPPADFRLEALQEDLVPAEVEFALFMQNAQTRIPSTSEVLTLRPHDERLHSFMVHRNLLPASFVRRVLQRENLFRQHVRQQESLQDMMQAAMSGQLNIGPGGMINVDPAQMFFILSVRRDHLLEDTTEALQKAAPADLQRQIKITFAGEDGEDAGGVSREFFRLLGEQLFSLTSQLFDSRVAEEARVLWFDQNSTKDASEFWLVGAIVGLAVYNNLPGLDVHFPVCTFKKLMGEPLGLEDMAEVQPAVAGSLRALLSWQPPDGMSEESAAELFEDTFCLTFNISQENGTADMVELKPGGQDLAVTLSNRQEFVQLYCDWVLDRSVAKQFEPFKRGFSRTCDSPIFKVLTGSELAQIVAGESAVELEDLRARAKFEGFRPDSEYIKGFWEILRGFDVEQRRRFLAFVTGSDRAPVGGLRELQLMVQKNGQDAERLPLAHTCFNLLLLPEYPSQHRLREALLTAIENSEGFGLQ